MPIENERKGQAYYGAVNYVNGKVCIHAYEKGNTESTIKFIEYLRSQNPKARIALIWDGASHHRSQMFRDYLEEVNQGKTEEEWLVTCIQLAPYAPEQNPMEDIWLQAKNILRKYWHLCKSFKVVKWLFEWFLREELFSFPKLEMYGAFSQIIT